MYLIKKIDFDFGHANYPKYKKYKQIHASTCQYMLIHQWQWDVSNEQWTMNDK